MDNVGNFISYFNPFNQGFSQATEDFKKLDGWKKTAVVAAAIFSGLSTLFLLGIGSVAAFRKTVEILKNDVDPVAKSTHRAASHEFSGSSNSSSSVSSSEMSFTLEETREEQLLRISNSVFENRDTLWEQARGDKERFLDLIREKYSSEGRSLSETLSDRDSLTIICRSGRIQHVLNLYKLRILSQVVWDKRDEFTAKALRLAGTDDDVKMLFMLTLLIRGFYQTHGMSLSEVLKDPASNSFFKQSGRLTLVLAIYQKLKTQEQPQTDEDRRDQRKRRGVRAQAAEHAQGVGFVTQLGMGEVADDPQKLRQELRRFLVKNHPDKNPDGDQDGVRAANEILQMMKDQNFDLYRGEIEQLRKQ